MGGWEWLTDFPANKVKPSNLFQCSAQPRLLWIKHLFIMMNCPLTKTLRFGLN